MATRVDGSVTYNPTKYEYYLTWEESNINIAANTSDVTVRVYARRTSTYTSYSSAGTSQIQIDGVNSSKLTGQTIDLQANQVAQLIQTYTRTITHNADGSKSITIKGGEAVASGSGILGANDSSYSPYKGTASKSITLSVIPREAQITDSSIDFTIGNSIPINFTNATTGYVQALTYVDGTLIKTQNLGQVTSGTLTFNGTQISNMYAEVPNALTVAAVVRLRTYSDSGYTTQVGSDSDKACTATVDSATNKPTFTTAVVENVDKSVAVVDKYSNTLVTSSTETLIGGSSHKNIGIQYIGKLRATISVANKMVPLNSATATKYRFTNGSYFGEVSEGAGDKTIDIDNVTTGNSTISAIDSRGLQTNVANSLSVFAGWSYIDAFGISAVRSNSIDTTTTLSFFASYWKKYFSSNTASNPGYGVLNTITMEYRYKESAKTWNTSEGTFTVTIATPAVITKSSHGLSTGDQVYFTTSGALPTGLSANTYYYVVKINSNSFNVSDTYAHAIAGTNKVNTSGSQSGTHTLWHCGMWTAISPTSDTSGSVTFSNTISGDLGSDGFNADKSFSIEVRVYDKLSQEIVETALPVGTPLIHLTKKGAAFGAKHTGTTGNIAEFTGKTTFSDEANVKGMGVYEAAFNGWLPLLTDTFSVRSTAYTNDPAAGSNITLNTTSTAYFQVGDKVNVSSSAGNENATITAVVTSTSITVDALALNHTTTSPLIRHATTNQTYVLYTGVDHTGEIQLGDRIRLVSGGITKYFIVHYISATVIVLFGGTDYYITPGDTVTDVYVSRQRFPFGFSRDRSKWMVSYTDTVDRNPSAVTGTPAQVTNAQIYAPIGLWDVAITQCCQCLRSASGTGAGIRNGLSTASNTLSDTDYVIRADANGASGDSYNPLLTGIFRFQKPLAVSAKTLYYWNHIETTTTAVTLTWFNATVTFRIDLTSAYF